MGWKIGNVDLKMKLEGWNDALEGLFGVEPPSSFSLTWRPSLALFR